MAAIGWLLSDDGLAAEFVVHTQVHTTATAASAMTSPCYSIACYLGPPLSRVNAFFMSVGRVPRPRKCRNMRMRNY